MRDLNFRSEIEICPNKFDRLKTFPLSLLFMTLRHDRECNHQHTCQQLANFHIWKSFKISLFPLARPEFSFKIGIFPNKVSNINFFSLCETWIFGRKIRLFWRDKLFPSISVYFKAYFDNISNFRSKIGIFPHKFDHLKTFPLSLPFMTLWGDRECNYKHTCKQLANFHIWKSFKISHFPFARLEFSVGNWNFSE